MLDHSRHSNIQGSMNSMYHLEQNKSFETNFVRIEVHHKGSEILSGTYLQQNFNTQIQVSSYMAWAILLVSSLFSAFVPCWLMWDVHSESFTRNSWRFFTISVLFLPFLLYEQRNLKDQKGRFFSSLTKENLKPIFVSTFNFCLWLLCLIYACKFTSMNHAVFLSSLRFFFLSALKIKNGQRFHQFEIAGSLLCTIGLLLMLGDSLTLPQVFDPGAQRYLRMQPWKRLLFGDSLALVGSIASVYLDQNYKVPEMPKFSYLFLYNLFLCCNLVTFGFFFGGNQFSYNVKFGILGLFTYQNFVSVFYVSVLLGFYLILFNILIAQIFNNVIINVAACFELVISALYWHVLSLQNLPSGVTCLGYAFILPGLIFTIGGQGAIDNQQNKINFQLYRPTEIRNTRYTRMTGVLPPTLKHSFSIQKQKHRNSINLMSPGLRSRKSMEKLPFQMILEEQQPQQQNQMKRVQ